MKKLLTILLIILTSQLLTSQILTNDGKITSIPYRIVPNDVSAWTMGTGTYVNDPTDNSIKCTSSGTAYIESTQAYGEWYFDLYSGGVSNFTFVHFISDIIDITSCNGYKFLLNSGEQFGSTVINAGANTTKFATNTGYHSNFVWYKIKGVRTITGITSWYVRGGEFGSQWILIDDSAFGSNPYADNTYTTSNYFILDLDLNDKIRNVRFKPLDGSYKTIVKQSTDIYFMLIILMTLYYERKKRNMGVSKTSNRH